jgi:Fe-S oxidoreductase/nitrate reductase gamma subunit
VTATRETFAGMGGVEKGLWYLASLLSTGVFAYGAWRLLRRWRSGRGAAPQARFGAALRIVFTHVWIRRRAGFGGYAHAGVFYGFLVLFAGTVILAFQDDFAEPVLGWTFWTGAFYKGYSLFLDLFGAALVVGLAFFVVRRLTTRPAKLTYGAGDWAFLLLLFFLGLSGFALEALRIAIDQPGFEVWAPLGYVAGKGLRAAGLGPGTAETLRHGTWWVHGVVALSFVAAIPRTKALHMLAGPVGVAVRDADAKRALPAEPEAGYATFSDFLPRHLVDLDSCTRCGRCHEACPATASGLPLSPRDLVLDLQRAAQSGADPGVASDTLWSCMQCMACVEICPVGIEHVPIINLLRRGLIEQGDLDDGLQNVLEAVATSGNSFGESRRKRARWTRELEFEVRDARAEPVDVLWFVGDYASLDPRNQRNTIALARLLEAAGVDFGILHDAERTAGNDVRRAGEEGLFRSLAEENIEQISRCSFQRILTSDPHGFNTLRNEYPGLGAPWTADQVVHHSQLLGELLEAGSLTVSQPLRRTVTYHDPCALGRHNGVYDAPRDLLSRIGLDLVEMPRNRDNSFCCGAGGGRIWMREPQAGRPSEDRIHEAVALGDRVTQFVVACPKDVTMYEDAIKTTGSSDRLELAELSELVLEACAIDVTDNEEGSA